MTVIVRQQRNIDGLGQRGFVALLTVVLLIIGAVLGRPGSFPELNGRIITPDFIGEVIGQLALPLGLMLATLVGLFNAINERVNDVTDPFQPGDIITLLKTKEFWTYMIASVVGIAQIFGFTLLNPEQQTLLVNTILGIIALLFGTWTERQAGKIDPPPDVTVAVDVSGNKGDVSTQVSTSQPPPAEKPQNVSFLSDAAHSDTTDIEPPDIVG